LNKVVDQIAYRYWQIFSSNIGIPAKFHIGASLNTTFKEHTLLSLVWQNWILPAYA